MFLVKAMRNALTSDAESYVMWQCDHFSVGPNDIHSAQSTTGGRPNPDAQRKVTLFEVGKPFEPSNELASLYIGNGESQFETVYVMNERGKTIDTIQARAEVTPVPEAVWVGNGGRTVKVGG